LGRREALQWGETARTIPRLGVIFADLFMGDTVMRRVTGIGGIFFKAKEPATLQA